MAKKRLRHHFDKGRELYEEYKREGNPAHIAEAIVNFQEALALTPHGHSNRSPILNELARALQKRYDLQGNADNLSLAIKYHQEVLALRPVGDPKRSTTLTNLANALRGRYELEGNVNDLSLSITYHQEALYLLPVGHPSRSGRLDNLGNTLRDRYIREGNTNDLSLSIASHQEALSLLPVGDPDRSITLNNLGLSFGALYHRGGNVDDLSLSITYHQEALSLLPIGHPSRSGRLDNLANALGLRYKHDGNIDDLSLSIEKHQEALSLFQVGHPGRSNCLNNLGLALLDRYNREGGLSDLALAITYRHEVLNLQPPGHPYRTQSLHILANCYWATRNEQESYDDLDFQLLDPAPALLGASSSPYPQIEEVECSSTDEDSSDPLRRKIISLLREASRSENCSPRDWLWATLDWIKYSREIDPASTTEAYAAAFHQLDIVLALGQSLDQRQDRLLSDNLMVKTRGLGNEAATWALQQGDPERAVELLEQGRSLLLAQLGRYRTELDDLRKADPELANRFENLSRQLDSSLVSNPKIEEASLTTRDPYEGYRRVSTEWNETVEKIRTLPNFDTFLKPVPYKQLQQAAAEGPVVIIIPNQNGSDTLIIREHEPIHRIHLPLSKYDRLAELADNFVHAIDADGIRAEKLCSANLRFLWKEVVGPIAQALQHDLGVPLGSRIWWCPTSMTSFLPLHAAWLYSKRMSEENFPNLYISSYTPTLQALLRVRRNAKAIEPKKLLIIAQPSTPGNSPLPCAMEEAAVIAKIVSPTQDVKMLAEEAGTCEAVQRQMESHPWMHFICHGIQVDRQPLDSYLLLQDGPLTLRMIIQQNLPNADFAFLSACHSAAGDKVLANEALHLAAAVQFAGFRGVVGTLWEMADAHGPPLAETFYRELVKHGNSRGAAKALSEAIKQLRRDQVPLNLWMRFVHIGI